MRSVLVINLKIPSSGHYGKRVLCTAPCMLKNNRGRVFEHCERLLRGRFIGHELWVGPGQGQEALPRGRQVASDSAWGLDFVLLLSMQGVLCCSSRKRKRFLHSKQKTIWPLFYFRPFSLYKFEMYMSCISCCNL